MVEWTTKILIDVYSWNSSFLPILFYFSKTLLGAYKYSLLKNCDYHALSIFVFSLFVPSVPRTR